MMQLVWILVFIYGYAPSMAFPQSSHRCLSLSSSMNHHPNTHQNVMMTTMRTPWMIPINDKKNSNMMLTKSTDHRTKHHPWLNSAMMDDSNTLEETQSPAEVAMVAPTDVAIGAVIGILGAFMHLVFRFWMPQYKTISRYWLAFYIFSASLLRTNKNTVNNLLALMVPPPLPGKWCVYVSGIVELVCSILLVVPRFATRGAYLTIGLLWAVFPSNIYHAVSKTAQTKIKFKATQDQLNFRVALQFLYLYWAAWFVN